MSADEPPTWPPAPGDKVLPRPVTAAPGPTYVVTEPEETDDELTVETVHHRKLHALSAARPGESIQNPLKTAREAIEAGRLSTNTTPVDNLKPYTLPRCERCQDPRTRDRPVSVPFTDEDRPVWLCRYCAGFYKGLKTGLDEADADLDARDALEVGR